MLFLSAQPDEYYFLWQLELQLFNFNSFGITANRIHVLLGYNPERGLSQEFQNFINYNKRAIFFAYPDTRKSRYYESSIRPHIIAKHFLAFPHLKEENIFYHDSDIIFKSLPQFRDLCKDKTWYASDTSNYLDCNYIKRTAGESILYKMCSTIGIAPSLVLRSDDNAGGAQYILKDCTHVFWQKIEGDCEMLYQLLVNYNVRVGFCNNEVKQREIQEWCADMWALWWNAILEGKEFKIHPELNFCWADTPIEKSRDAKILHYTGIYPRQAKRIFRKLNYKNYPPYFDDFKELDVTLCGYELIKLINRYNSERLKERMDLSDVSFLIRVRIDSKDRLENLYAVTNYIHLHFITTILIIEADDTSKIDPTLLPESVQHFFVKDDTIKFCATKCNNYLIQKAATPYIVVYDVDVIIPPSQILESTELLRQKLFSMVYPYDGNFFNVENLLKNMFIKLQDAAFLEANKGKMGLGTKRSHGGCVFLNRLSYVSAGMENENISSWGPDDVERVKRMRILGYKVKRIAGNLYHLQHERGINSFYEGINERCDLMTEYLNISKMKKHELLAYVQTWGWTQSKI